MLSAATRSWFPIEGVISDSDPDGTASLLGLDLSPERVQAAVDYITSIAKPLAGANDDRSFDQL